MKEHQMHLEESYSTGASKWKCDECEREFVMQFPDPESGKIYKKIILKEGDTEVIHLGATGGIQMSAKVNPDIPPPSYEANEDESDDDLPDEFRNWKSSK
jgi:hypothetical protein